MVSGGLRADIQAAKDRMQGTIGTGREFKHLEEHLWEREVVEMTCGGTYGRGQGLLVLTNSRLLFTFSGVMSQTTEDFPLDKISSIQWSAGMLMGTVTIFASGNKAEIKNVGKQDGKGCGGSCQGAHQRTDGERSDQVVVGACRFDCARPTTASSAVYPCWLVSGRG